MHPFGNQPVHMLIQPGEIVFPLFLLGLGPAALQTRIADAGLPDETAELRKVGIVPVHRLRTDRPDGGGVQPGSDRLNLTDDRKPGRMGLDILPGDGFHQFLGLQGQRKRKRQQECKGFIHCIGFGKGYILPSGRHQRFQDRAYRSSPGNRPGNSRRRSGRSWPGPCTGASGCR